MRRWPLGAMMLGAAYAAQSGHPELAKSVVTYGWHSAPMAPVYRSLYVVRVEPGGAGTLMYEFGPSGSSQETTRKFQLSAADETRLLDALMQAKVLDGGWMESANKLMGAPQERVEIADPSGQSLTDRLRHWSQRLRGGFGRWWRRYGRRFRRRCGGLWRRSRRLM